MTGVTIPAERLSGPGYSMTWWPAYQLMSAVVCLELAHLQGKDSVARWFELQRTKAGWPESGPLEFKIKREKPGTVAYVVANKVPVMEVEL